jgi:Tol biopolymer transport system component
MNSAFSRDGKEFFFNLQFEGSWSIFRTTDTGDGWSKPEPLPFSDKYEDRDFTISPDEQRIYFGSNRPVNESGMSPTGRNVFYTQRLQGGGWTEPQSVGDVINGLTRENFPCVTANGNLYFFSDRDDGIGRCDLYLSEFRNSEWQKPVVLPDSVNSIYNDWDAWIAPDESYVVFSSDSRPDSVGGMDLYVSFRTEDGGWTKALNMGERVNSTSGEICPSVTLDGRFLFFTSRRRGKLDVMWMTTDVINDLRKQISQVRPDDAVAGYDMPSDKEEDFCLRENSRNNSFAHTEPYQHHGPLD